MTNWRPTGFISFIFDLVSAKQVTFAQYTYLKRAFLEAMYGASCIVILSVLLLMQGSEKDIVAFNMMHTELIKKKKKISLQSDRLWSVRHSWYGLYTILFLLQAMIFKNTTLESDPTNS